MSKKIAYAMIAVVLVASGTYLFVYLYRWEWNRALIAGVFVIAAEVALFGGLLLDRMRSLEARLMDAEKQQEHATTVQHLKETAPPPKASFKWLGGDELSVFVPVLMGAGILFSGIAWLVEKVARATARPALEHGLAMRLAPLALPDGGFLAPVDAPLPRPSRRDRVARYRTLLILLAVTALASLVVDELGDLTQNRPDPDLVGQTGVITLRIDDSGWTRGELVAGKALWASCQGTVSRNLTAADFRLTGGMVKLSITPAPGVAATKRLTGCLEDATIDNVQAGVVSIVNRPTK